MEQLNHCPKPWRVQESVGGKTYLYDANGKPVIVPNVSSTGRTPDELREIYRHIASAVNNEFEAWRTFDKGPSFPVPHTFEPSDICPDTCTVCGGYEKFHKGA